MSLVIHVASSFDVGVAAGCDLVDNALRVASLLVRFASILGSLSSIFPFVAFFRFWHVAEGLSSW